MTDNDTERRLARLRLRPTLAEKSDDFLVMCLEDSLAFFIDYTHRINDPGQRVDSLICELAVLRINAEGVENVRVAKEGEVEREWYEAIPPMILPRLNAYRLMAGVNAEHGV